MGQWNIQGLIDSLVVKGADNTGFETKRLRLQKNILADVAGFDHRIAHTPFPVLSGDTAIFGGNHQADGRARHPLLGKGRAGQQFLHIPSRYGREQVLCGTGNESNRKITDGGFHTFQMSGGVGQEDEFGLLPGGYRAAEGRHAAFTLQLIIAENDVIVSYAHSVLLETPDHLQPVITPIFKLPPGPIRIPGDSSNSSKVTYGSRRQPHTLPLIKMLTGNQEKGSLMNTSTRSIRRRFECGDAKSARNTLLTRTRSDAFMVFFLGKKIMELDSRFVGTRLRPYHTDVDWRMTTNYAAATGDQNPLYLDDRQKDAQMAPPMLAVALTWPISSHLGNYLLVDDFPADVLLTQVHHSERLDFYRPIRPGDRLTINGRLAGISPHRAGTHCVMRYQATDPEGTPVFTEHVGVVLRGVGCKGMGRNLNLPGEPQGNWESGPLWRKKIHIDPLLPYVYDGCSDIVFAIHTSPAFATEVGLPGIILQGTCTLALAARELVNQEADANPARLKALSGRFSGMVRPGSDIRVNLLSRNNNDLYFEVDNQEGEKAIRKGHARICE